MRRLSDRHLPVATDAPATDPHLTSAAGARETLPPFGWGIALLLAAALVACGDDDAPADAGTPPMDGEPPADGATMPDGGLAVGTVEDFAELAGNSEGLAFGRNADGETVLFVGLLAQSTIVAVSPDGASVEVARVPRPLGIAVRADGDLVVCGKADETAGAPGVLWRVSVADGTTEVIVDTAPAPLETTNYVAIAPDGSLLFSDSAANVVYRADADGGPATLVTDAFTYPNGIAFAPDGRSVYVSSWDTGVIHRLSFDPSTGAYGAPEVALENVINTDGIHVAADGTLVLVSNPEGILVVEADGTPTQIAEPRPFGLPANGAFGSGAYGDGWLYVTNLLGRAMARVYVGRDGLPLPVQ